MLIPVFILISLNRWVMATSVPASTVTWVSPKSGITYSPNDLINASWSSPEKIVSPSFSLCALSSSTDPSILSRKEDQSDQQENDTTGSGEETTPSTDPTCGDAVWPTVTTSSTSGHDKVSLAVPPVTASSSFYLIMTSNSGDTYQSPSFNVQADLSDAPTSVSPPTVAEPAVPSGGSIPPSESPLAPATNPVLGSGNTKGSGVSPPQSPQVLEPPASAAPVSPSQSGKLMPIGPIVPPEFTPVPGVVPAPSYTLANPNTTPTGAPTVSMSPADAAAHAANKANTKVAEAIAIPLTVLALAALIAASACIAVRRHQRKEEYNQSLHTVSEVLMSSKSMISTASDDTLSREYPGTIVPMELQNREVHPNLRPGRMDSGRSEDSGYSSDVEKDVRTTSLTQTTSFPASALVRLPTLAFHQQTPQPAPPHLAFHYVDENGVGYAYQQPPQVPVQMANYSPHSTAAVAMMQGNNMLPPLSIPFPGPSVQRPVLNRTITPVFSSQSQSQIPITISPPTDEQQPTPAYYVPNLSSSPAFSMPSYFSLPLRQGTSAPTPPAKTDLGYIPPSLPTPPAFKTPVQIPATSAPALAPLPSLPQVQVRTCTPPSAVPSHLQSIVNAYQDQQRDIEYRDSKPVPALPPTTFPSSVKLESVTEKEAVEEKDEETVRTVRDKFLSMVTGK